MRIDVYYHVVPKIEVVHTHVFPTMIHEHHFVGPLTVLLKEDKPKIQGGMFMFIVKDDNSDVGYQIMPGQVTDVEGNVIPGETILVLAVSDNVDVVQLTVDPTDPMKGTAHFGKPGTANINITESLADGSVVGSFGAQFTVTTGDPAAITGGTIAFEGLKEV